jgi:hypothetical protein
MTPILPHGWPRPSGYSDGMLAPQGSRTLHIAGNAPELETRVTAWLKGIE